MEQTKPIRVLHIITRMIVGGAQENTLLSVIGLDAMPEYEVTLMSGIDRGREGELLSMAREKCRLIIVPEMGRSINPFSDLIAFWKIYGLIRKGRYHIVHTHSSKAGVLGRVAAWLAGTPIIVHTLHSLVFHDYQPWFINKSWRGIKKMCAPITDFFISVSQIIVDKAVAAGVAKPEKFRTIYSGMELDWFLNAKFDSQAVRREFGIPKNAPVVGKIARLFPLKGHDQLMDAAPEIVKRVPDVRFFLIGDGILLEHLQERARGYGILENFVFAGLIDRERIPEMISAMDIVVHTSLREGLARVLPQALAMGKPCVSFNIDGAPEVVINDKTGCLVEAYDYKGLAGAVSRLLNDADLRAKMGENGRRQVDPAFRAETMVREIAEVYDMLLKRHSKRIEKFNA
ncbi:MAG: glycosyltransferase family 4 protein [Acidobacteria bacterium]|nr:glycosyltransferase family 4 protein [Acidobacteriota bacterium]MCA1640249.1 glycosyltransferase family 4 protein [Acidobacteriota bacterium]